ncbi:DUF1275 domain-containing protein [Skermania sp. ID1734]|uniref:YoaK family protein n=1 Tax=Skermania sp. ID1734 TaxID=2597516 RepID=UPI00117D428D|nr:YoaK family protein [Skermania sp. ID1734]TSE00453.1 DUF1275 domain-containing protein [Skermania sp. ID1734]
MGLLACVAGFVNAVFIVVLIFPVSHLSGSIANLSINAITRNLWEFAVIALILLGFLCGAAGAGSVLGHAERTNGVRRGLVLVLEAALLIAAIFAPNLGLQAFLAATACGMQNGVTSNYRGMAVRTTHLTGTVTDLGVMLGRSRHHGLDWRQVAMHVQTVALFIVGGLLGAIGGTTLGHWALLIPAAVCTAAGISAIVSERWRGSAG